MADETQEAAEAPRKRRWLYLLPALFFGALSVLFLFRLFAGDPHKLPSALVGRPAPVTVLPGLEGLKREGAAVPGFSTEELKGKVFVLNVFASWCVPCRDEHPILMEMAKGEPYASGKAVLLGLNYKDEGENARRFLAVLGNPYAAVGVDRSGRAGIEWGVYGVPETFVIGRDGQILHKQVGPINAATRAGFAKAVADAAAR